MVNGTERSSAASLLRTLESRRTKAATDKKQSTFADQLQNSISGSERVTGRRAMESAGSRVSNRQSVATTEQARQNTAAPSAAPQKTATPASTTNIGPFAAAALSGNTAAAAAPKAATAAPQAAATTDSPADPLAVLKDAMQKAGISANVDLQISDEIVYYPGGSFRNHLVKADFGGGVTENYNVDMMMKNPWLTAFEMKRLMTSGGNAA